VAATAALVAAGSLTAAAASSSTGTATGTPHNMLLKQYLAKASDDLTDSTALSALCQSYLGSANPYKAISPNIDVISGDTTVPVGSQTGCSAAQNETTVAVNPENPKNLVAGSNDYRVYNSRESRNDASGWAYVTFDGGATWKDVQVPHLTYQTGGTGAYNYFDSAGDPSLAFGPHNTVYYANLVFSRTIPSDGSQQASGVAVSVSHNGGLTWSQPKTIELDGVTASGSVNSTNIFNDKEWIAADPYTGDVYVTWTQFTYDASGNYVDSPVVAVHSGDFGGTWSSKTQISPSSTNFTGGITSFGSGTNPQVGNDGTLYVAYETSVCKTLACNAPTDHDEVVVAVSHDHGKTFTNYQVSKDFDFPFNNDVQNNTLTGENFRINAFPQLAYDRVTGNLWVTWADDRNGAYDSSGNSIKTDGSSFVASSHGGQVWSQTTRVAASNSDEVFPAIAAYAGRVVVSFYTRAYDPTGIGLDYAYVSAWANHIGQAPTRRITTQSENPQVQFVSTGAVSGAVLQGIFIGDYTAVALGRDLIFHPVWTDFRGNPGVDDPNQDVVTQAIPALG
jgi:hypothetical protein